MQPRCAIGCILHVPTMGSRVTVTSILTAAWQLPRAEQIDVDQVSAINRATPAGLLGAVFNAAIVAASFWGDVPTQDILCWFCATALITAYVALRWSKSRARALKRVGRRMLTRMTLTAIMLALPWSLVVLLYLGAVPHNDELILIALCAGMAASGSVYLAPVFPAALAYMAVILLPAAFKCILVAPPGYGLLGWLTLSYAGFLFAVIATNARLSIERTHAFKLLDDRSTDLQAIIDNFPGGIAFCNSDLRVVVCNDRAKELLDLPERFFADGPPLLQDIIRFNAARGEFGAGDIDEQVASQLALTKERRTYQFECERPNGTVLDVRGAPIDNGGFITTCLDITERYRWEAKIAHMAMHDALTDLPNRVLFRECLGQAVSEVRDGGRNFAVLMLDLDRFKEINDTLGHRVGDELLKVVARRLRNCVREGDMLARLGGDEFSVIQRVTDAATEAAALAMRIQQVMSASFDLGDHHATVGVSIGVAVAPMDGKDADQLLKNADLALYRAKSDGQRCYRFFEQEMDARMQARRRLERDLRTALANNELQVYYQPLISLERNEICGLEALARWNHAEYGMIPPEVFIPIAEETGLIMTIGEWVLRQACTEVATWPKHIKVAANLSPAQFKCRALRQMVVSALAQSGLEPDRLELEITESVILEDVDGAFTTLKQLRDLGIRIALDDFGTGYSSLSNLRKFSFDKIKIDRSFVADLSSVEVNAIALVRSMTQLGRSLGMVITAEGVETEEQLDLLRAEGCTEIQGYYVCRPSPGHELQRRFLPHTTTAASAA
jgi:diguanylate cyclase (GGDEF)-like protein